MAPGSSIAGFGAFNSVSTVVRTTGSSAFVENSCRFSESVAENELNRPCRGVVMLVVASSPTV